MSPIPKSLPQHSLKRASLHQQVTMLLLGNRQRFLRLVG